MQNNPVEVTDEYDKEFINLIMEVEKRSENIKKHDKLRVNSWCKKLCQVTNNIEWKKNRNLHAICLLDMVLNEHFEEPYNKFAPEGSVPIISKTIVKSRLSAKFLKNTMQMQNQNQERNYYDDKANDYQQQENQMPVGNNQQVGKMGQSNLPQGKAYQNMLMGSEDSSKLKEYIKQLQKEIQERDELIERYKDDKMKADKRIQELEKMLSNFME